VNAAVRPVPLGSFYPGDRYVDVIGVDAYDEIEPGFRGSRLAALLAAPDGLRQVRAFAARHHKPMSVPEWGIGPPAASGQAGAAGDDPAYVNALAREFRSGRVLYEGYFAGGVQGPELLSAERSLRAYRRHFGAGGDAAS
jgi:hypothetical protein